MKRKQKKKKIKATPYDHIRKPTPKSGFAFKDRKRQMRDKDHRDQMDEY